MSEYTLSNSAQEYLDFYMKGNDSEEPEMYDTIYDQVKEATEGPYQYINKNYTIPMKGNY